MKTIFLILITLTMGSTLFASADSFTNNNNANRSRLCKIFSNKAISYKKHMRNDEYAKKSLESYEARAKFYCNK